MEAVTLARPYARAAFEFAREHDGMDAWSAHLAAAAAIAEDPRIAGLGNDPRVPATELAGLHRPPAVEDGTPFDRFLMLLADNRRLVLLPHVAQHFETLRRAAENTVRVRLCCAAEPGEEQTSQLLAALRQRLDSKVDLEVDVDPEIMGGAIIDVGGEVIDASVRARLRQLQSALAS